MRESVQKHIHGTKRAPSSGRIREGTDFLAESQVRKPKAGIPLFIEDPRFKLINTLSFRVPEDHDPKDPAFKFINEKMADGYSPTTSFEAGRLVNVDFYELNEGPTLEDCLCFNTRKMGLLTGPEGFFLSWIELGEELPEEHWLLSLDKEETLRKDAYGNPRLPSVFKSSMKTIVPELYHIRVDGPLSSKNCLMIFTYKDNK